MRSLIPAMVLFLSASIPGCASHSGRYAGFPLPPGTTVYLDEGATCLHRIVPELGEYGEGEYGYSVLILERQADRRRTRYEIDVVSNAAQCVASGYLYDSIDGTAEYSVDEDGPLFLAPEARSVLSRWDEQIRTCR